MMTPEQRWDWDQLVEKLRQSPAPTGQIYQLPHKAILAADTDLRQYRQRPRITLLSYLVVALLSSVPSFALGWLLRGLVGLG